MINYMEFLKRTLIIVLIVSFIFFVGIFSPTPPHIKIVTPISVAFPDGVNSVIGPIYLWNIMEINRFVDNLYSEKIYPEGKKRVENELSYVRQLPDDNSKLDEIFRWQMEDWRNPAWDEGWRYTNNENPFWLNNNSFFHSDLKLLPKREFEFTLYAPRNPNGTYYGNDPNWLAYNKFGACRELSTLFSYMANQAGIESRTVQTGFYHQWAEVKINGEWMYYDPWCAREHDYYNPIDGNFTFRNKWFNKIEYFEENCRSYAYVNFYNDFIPNPIATQTYSFSYLSHHLKKTFNIQ